MAGESHSSQASLEEAEGADEENDGAVGGVRVDLRHGAQHVRHV